MHTVAHCCLLAQIAAAYLSALSESQIETDTFARLTALCKSKSPSYALLSGSVP